MPVTSNISLNIPNTGDLSGAWGTTAVNTNMTQFDGLFGGVLNLSFSSATTITLSTNGTTITPAAGPNQSNNAAMVISGTLSGNCTINLVQPGVYRVYNNCTVGSNVVKLAPSTGTGTVVGVPDGEMRRFFYDGTNVLFMDMPHVGSIVNMAIGSVPAWVSACSFIPYLGCDGSVYNISSYPVLGNKLGSAFGGNGVTTFGVPDLVSRAFVMLDASSAFNRLTAGGSGVAGNLLGGHGGSEFLQSHTHANTLSDPTHAHTIGGSGSFMTIGGSGIGFAVNQFGQTFSGVGSTNTNITGITINNANVGSGGYQNVQPTLVGGLSFIKT